ncbi:MAG: AraC family transcriptional regulator [Spirochaetales bacterium]|nr:AraC family transcriptional regulator [Spirochaetales bacterium]
MDSSTLYFPVQLNESFSIEKIYTIHYFEYSRDFHFAGESHNFWELLYVDMGVVEVLAGETRHTLFKGDIIFHEPGEFHSLWANGRTAPNLVVLSFECTNPSMAWFAGKILRIKEAERNLLGRIVYEAQQAFDSPLEDPGLKALNRREQQSFGCEQLIKIYMEEFLIRLMRQDVTVSVAQGLENTIEKKSRETVFNKVVNYLMDNLGHQFSMDELCRDVGYSRSYLHNVFKKRTGHSVMEYYKRLKIEKAKQLIREGADNFTQISYKLDFSSLQYFSRLFKKITGMTPGAYASSVKLKSEYYADTEVADTEQHSEHL